MERTCNTCGGTFKTFQSSINRGGGKYCSIKCRPYAGSGNPKWRGGRVVHDGRVMIYAPEHPGANLMGGRYIYEYRLVAERTLGRHLSQDEIVHHINGDQTDNRPENLVVMDSERARKSP